VWLLHSNKAVAACDEITRLKEGPGSEEGRCRTVVGDSSHGMVVYRTVISTAGLIKDLYRVCCWL